MPRPLLGTRWLNSDTESGHRVIWSSGHLVIGSFGHRVTWSSGHLVSGSFLEVVPSGPPAEPEAEWVRFETGPACAWRRRQVRLQSFWGSGNRLKRLLDVSVASRTHPGPQ